MRKQNEITVEDLCLLDEKDYLLVDVRHESAFNHGYIPRAVNIFLEDVQEKSKEFPRDKKVILYCAKGVLTDKPAEWLRTKGFDGRHLVGGYIAWLKANFAKELELGREEEKPLHLEIEKSLRKKFHRSIFSKFAKAINQYELVQAGDKIAVCISGGKDSMLLAKLFQELKRHNKFPFELVFLIMNPGYSVDNLEIIIHNAKLLQIPYTIFTTNIFDSVFEVEKSPCYLCARMRRGYLYSKAKELGCNKIALGHHYDDVIETILMSMLYGAQIQTMMPKLHSTNFEGMELIRPMYLIREEDIKHWRDYNQLFFIQCACRFTDTCSIEPNVDGTGSKRMEIKHMIQEMKKSNPFVESNIFKSVENVNIDTVVAYKARGVKHHFLDTYS
ncbi:MAG: rhodanese-like domain-containing protein [Lachnospiraceae bacterium]|nr:rhodanese-like domain-containing protein [Lachnospiraceae bacterium]